MAGLDNLEGRVVVVTGGASGIGRGIAEEFLARGARVVVADLDDEGVWAAATELGAVGIRTDVSDAASVEALAATVIDRFGRVDVVCNNAGVGPKAGFAELTLADWTWVLNVNLFGVIHGVHAFLPHLTANDDGAWIVNTSSISCFLAPSGYAHYVTSKAAVNGLSQVLRAELAEAGSRVGVTVLHPGAVRTNIKESLRSRPAELAGDSGLADFDLARRLPDSVRWATPRETGRIVVRAVRAGDPHAFTHPEMIGDVQRYFREIEDGMRQYPGHP